MGTLFHLVFASLVAVLGLSVAVPAAQGAVPTAKRVPSTVGVVPLAVEGETSHTTRNELTLQVEHGLRRAGAALVAVGSEPAGCVPSECAQAVAHSSGADFVVRGTVRRVDTLYRFTLEARRKNGRLVGTADDVCEICGLQEVGEMLANRAASLAQRIAAEERAVPILRIKTNPPGAELWVDDRSVGIAPVEIEVGPGAHTVRVGKRGFVAQSREVVAVNGLASELEVTLAVAPKRRASAVLIIGSVSLGAGVASVAVGVPLLLLNNDPVQRDCRADREGNCKNLHDTAGLGATAVAAGAVFVVTGVALVAIAVSKRKRGRRVAVIRSGLGVRF